MVLSSRANIILTNGQDQDIWVKEMDLPVPPAPGLGIRIDTYDMVNVDSVIIGDEGYDVTCLVSPEGRRPFTPKRCERLGFRRGEDNPQGSAFEKSTSGRLQQPHKSIVQPLQEKRALKALIYYDRWIKKMDLPFPPFVELGIRFEADKMLTIWSLVIGDPGYDVTCITENKGLLFTTAEWERFGFESGSYPP